MQNFIKKLTLFGIIALSGLQTYTFNENLPVTKNLELDTNPNSQEAPELTPAEKSRLAELENKNRSSDVYGSEDLNKQEIDEYKTLTSKRDKFEKAKTKALTSAFFAAIHAHRAAQIEVAAHRNSMHSLLKNPLLELSHAEEGLKQAYQKCSKDSDCSSEANLYLKQVRDLGINSGYQETTY